MAHLRAESITLADLNVIRRCFKTYSSVGEIISGSGKTRVLTHRIAHLIKNLGVSPYEILAITFTNKAASEMKERVGALVGPVAENMWVSTFHSACVKILRREGAALGYPSSFTINDQADAIRLTTYVMRDLNMDTKQYPPRGVHSAISKAKNELISPKAFEQLPETYADEQVAQIYHEYQTGYLNPQRWTLMTFSAKPLKCSEKLLRHSSGTRIDSNTYL